MLGDILGLQQKFVTPQFQPMIIFLKEIFSEFC